MKNLVVGNWKMFKIPAEAVRFVTDLQALAPDPNDTDAVICPPFVDLPAAGAALEGTAIGLGAQTMHWADTGAFTGEVSPPMLVACGVRWVILGHSERRAYCGEIDTTINKKIPAALAHGITPIVAVGETDAEHQAGQARERVIAQIQAAFAGVPEADVIRCVVAYEPIWAIGTGNVDSPENANAIMGAIRAAVPGLEKTRLLYGGSVKPDNIAALVAQEHINGALVGGASLDPKSFAALLRNARQGVTA
ncbi:MAG: triose-phosphate isomerase [Candidatus Velthaea sp.]|jgi:triosephosphate isomerase